MLVVSLPPLQFSDILVVDIAAGLEVSALPEGKGLIRN
jgi:hypothetical protein